MAFFSFIGTGTRLGSLFFIFLYMTTLVSVEYTIFFELEIFLYLDFYVNASAKFFLSFFVLLSKIGLVICCLIYTQDVWTEIF